MEDSPCLVFWRMPAGPLATVYMAAAGLHQAARLATGLPLELHLDSPLDLPLVCNLPLLLDFTTFSCVGPWDVARPSLATSLVTILALLDGARH